MGSAAVVRSARSDDAGLALGTLLVAAASVLSSHSLANSQQTHLGQPTLGTALTLLAAGGGLTEAAVNPAHADLVHAAVTLDVAALGTSGGRARRRTRRRTSAVAAVRNAGRSIVAATGATVSGGTIDSLPRVAAVI